MVAYNEASIQVDGERIVFTDEGQGPPVLLLHGAVTNRHLWDPVVERLRDRYRLLAPDLVGYGDSSRPHHTHLGLDAQGRALEAFLQLVGAVPCAIVGHGMGGGVAQDMAARHPERLTALVLVASVTGTTWPSRDFLRLQQTDSPDAVDPETILALLKDHLQHGLPRPEALPAGWDRPFLEPWEGDEGRDAAWRTIQALDSRDTLDLEDRLARVHVPTLLVWGEEDQVYPLARGMHLRDLFPEATLETMPGVGHYPTLEAPDAFSDLLERALRIPAQPALHGKSPLP